MNCGDFDFTEQVRYNLQNIWMWYVDDTATLPPLQAKDSVINYREIVGRAATKWGEDERYCTIVSSLGGDDEAFYHARELDRFIAEDSLARLEEARELPVNTNPIIHEQFLQGTLMKLNQCRVEQNKNMMYSPLTNLFDSIFNEAQDLVEKIAR